MGVLLRNPFTPDLMVDTVEFELPPEDDEPLHLFDHNYLSTACYHHLHNKCRLTCKYCKYDNFCVCHCHKRGKR